MSLPALSVTPPSPPPPQLQQQQQTVAQSVLCGEISSERTWITTDVGLVANRRRASARRNDFNPACRSL